MQQREPWESETTRDKLDIFVSSRLKECKAERTAARSAIQSINHNPVLFEHLGARSTKPRTLYLSRLRDSQIMVAIHRLGYGYVDAAGGMDISGLEDEFVYAQAHGIPTLLYVYEDGTGRDERLTKLIEKASPNITIWFYRDPDELSERIRDDVTAEITKFVIRPEVTRAVMENSSADVLERATLRQGVVIARPAVLSDLIAASEQHSILCVFGRPGIGKTTLVAQYASEHNARYVRVTGLPPLDIFTVGAKVLRNNGQDITYSTLEGARLGFSSAWADAGSINLVVDECEFIDELLSAVEMGGGSSPEKRLVVTARVELPNHASFEVPPLTQTEVAEMTAGMTLQPAVASGALTPLEVQGALVEQAPVPGESPYDSEIISYLALSPAPLTAAEMLSLLGNEQLGIEKLYSELARFNRLIDDSPSGFWLAHQQTAEVIRERVQSSPQKLKFYASRLKEVFHARGDFRLSYKVVDLLKDGSADEFALPAIRQSAQVGDFRFGREIAERLLADALNGERRRDAFVMMLSLVYPMELMGDTARAAEILRQAEVLAPTLGDDEVASAKEVALASRARRTLAESDVAGLEAVHEQYAKSGSVWDHARTGLELSAIYVASKAYESAVAVLRPTLREFVEVGDEYGIDLAERNLAAALAALSGYDGEVDELVSRIAARSSESVDPRRQKAWQNNILSRRYRLAGRLDDAERVTKETIALSIELGEESLTAMTYINLGNVYRDKEATTEALAAYAKAGELAQHCGRRDIEADSSRFRAGVLNDLPANASIVPDRLEQAKVFAQHAIGLLQGSVYREGIARSYVELGAAEAELGDHRAASSAYFRAAEQFPLVPDSEAYDAAFIRATEHALDFAPSFYVEELSRLLGVVQTQDGLGDQFLNLIEPILLKAPRDHLVRILGRHLQTLRAQLPPLLRPILIEAIADAVDSLQTQIKGPEENWRVLYAGFLTPFLSQNSRGFDVHRRLAEGFSRAVDGLDVRFTEYGDQVWTVVLDGEVPITLTIMPMDDSASAASAAQALALFLKAFERAIREIIGKTDIFELPVQIADYSLMAEDLKETTTRLFDLPRVLDEQSAAATRTDDFGSAPVFVFLHPDFLQRASAGEGVSGSMQSFLGLTLVELLYQFFKGEVNHDEIRPKIVSLVRETIS